MIKLFGVDLFAWVASVGSEAFVPIVHRDNLQIWVAAVVWSLDPCERLAAPTAVAGLRSREEHP